MTPGARTREHGTGWSTWLRRVALGLVVLLVVVEGVDRLRSDGGGRTGADRHELPRWELLGCWELGLDPWRASRTDTSRPARDGSPPPVASVPGGPPGLVMLLPDSVDPWGRRMDAYRAVPVPDTGAGRPDLRWFVRADTLWLVWSGGGMRGGVALRRFDDHLMGRARAVGDSVDASARAEAWPVDCSTLERRRPDRRRR